MNNTGKEKILYVITKSNFGGAQRYVYDLANHLPKDTYDVVVAFGGSGALKHKLSEKNIRTIQIKGLGRDINILREFIAFRWLFSILRSEKPDVIHLNSSKVGGLGALIARLMGVKKIIFTAHGWAFNERRNILYKSLIWFLSWLTALLVTDIITISYHDLRQARHFPFVSRQKLHIIPNGISSFPVKERAVAQKELGIADTNNKLILGTIAELHKNKGLNVLIEALSFSRKRFLLCIIGDGEEQDSLKELAQSRNVSASVVFSGFRDNAASYLSAFDIFVLPSFKEGLPYTLLEAGYVGLPTIASDTGGISDIIEHKKTGMLTPPGNIMKLAKTLDYIAENKYSREAWGENLQRKVRENFRHDTMVEKTRKVYRLY